MKSLIVLILTLLVLFGASAAWLLSRTGAVEFPGGFVVDIDMVRHAFAGSDQQPMGKDEIEGRIQLPPGFSMQEWVTGIRNARMLLVTEAGDLLISSPRSDSIYLVESDADQDGSPDGVRTLLQGLDRPHGLDWHGGWLYIGEGDAISRIRFEPESGKVEGTPERIITGLPNGGNHWTKTVRVGPDEKLYVSIGSSCNVCEESDPRRAALLRYELDGSGEEIVATGLRNAVDFDWHPETGDLFATDNGRDLLGDDFPPCEINRIQEGKFYGWPYANAPAIPDPDFGAVSPAKVAATIPPAHALPAHTAPLGIAFYDGETFPEKYQNVAFVALHGSWNRSEKQGYEVVAVEFSEDGKSRAEPFITGFQIGDDVRGRPVAVAVGPQGELFVSDDYTGSVYRVVYGEPGGSAEGHVPARLRNPERALATTTTAERVSAMPEGQALWQVYGCAACHGQGQGNRYGRPLIGLASRYDVASLERFLMVPQPPMPLYPLTDAERRSLAIYLLMMFK